MRGFIAIAAITCLSLPAGALAELRAYDVDPQYRQEVFEALDGVLRDRPAPIGRVEQLPTGQLLIDASPDVHEQIGRILATIAAQEPTRAPRIWLRYWVVLGTPNAPDDAGLPAILGAVLDEIETVHGALGFRVLGNAGLVTESGQSGELTGNTLSVEQETYAEGTTLNAHIDMTFVYPVNDVNSNGPQNRQIRAQEVELRTTLESGDIVVLGENSLGENAIDGSEQGGTLFYIVQWPED